MAEPTYYLDINGLSKHLNTDVEYNEKNYGLGITREKERQKQRIIDILTAGTYQNSFGNQTTYAGAGIAKRFGQKYYADLGVVGGAMTGYEDSISPMAALYAAFGKEDLAKLRLMYAPETEKNPATMMLNLGIPLK